MAPRHPGAQLQVAVQCPLYTHYWLEFRITYISRVLDSTIHSADTAEKDIILLPEQYIQITQEFENEYIICELCALIIPLNTALSTTLILSLLHYLVL